MAPVQYVLKRTLDNSVVKQGSIKMNVAGLPSNATEVSYIRFVAEQYAVSLPVKGYNEPSRWIL